MAYIQWQQAFEVGIPKIDEQHKVLLGFINTLAEDREASKQAIILRETLTGLVDYTKTHFSTEEEIMAQVRYPKLAEHQSQHKMLIKQVIIILEKVRDNPDLINEELMIFLKTWLINHVMGHDKQLGEYYNRISWAKQRQE